MSAGWLHAALQALEKGHTMEGAAGRAGVSPQALYLAMKDPATLEAVHQARARGRTLLESSVLDEAMRDGKLALDVLSRRSRAWQKKDALRHEGKVTITGPKLSELEPAERRALLLAASEEE